MNHTALRAFHAVATHLSFTRASRATGLAQPALSAQVKRLESGHEAALFDRHGRGGVSLTPLGQRLLDVTTRLFAAEEEARALLEGMRTLRRGHLRIAADSATHVMAALAEMRAEHPGLTFSLTSDNSSAVLEQVLDHRADIAISARATSDPRLHSVVMKRDRLVLFMPGNHVLAAQQAVNLALLEQQDLVIRERGSITREVFEVELARAGITPGRLMEVQGREAVREAVAAGFGIGIVFESELPRDAGFKALAVADADLAVAEYAVCLMRRARLPLIRRFFAVIQELDARKEATERAQTAQDLADAQRIAEALAWHENREKQRQDKQRKAHSQAPRARVIG
jgi:aminoethylphosphonate catabolism LysR family transcriptional regulator